MGWVVWGEMGGLGRDGRSTQPPKRAVWGVPHHHHRGSQHLPFPTDVDECGEGLSQCGPFSVCLNTPGSYRCECRSGYRLAEDGHACVRKCQPQNSSPNPSAPLGSPPAPPNPHLPAALADPCEDGSHPCAPRDRARCLPRAGGIPACECLPGYTGDGRDCTGRSGVPGARRVVGMHPVPV